MGLKITLLFSLILWKCYFCAEFLKDQSTGEKSCFCKLGGEVDDCTCTVESVDTFNNNNIFPRSNSLLERDYFKYYPVDLQQPCKFWKPSGHCKLKDCGVKPCTEEEVPEGLRNGSREDNSKPSAPAAAKYKEKAQTKGCQLQPNDTEKELSKVDKFISDASNEAFKDWSQHDAAQTSFCELDDEASPTLEYVNLLLNPERFTGHAGPEAHRIWRTIYEENCFNDGPLESGNVFGISSHSASMCLEKRAFYRMISGLHTSINTHLSARYFFPKKSAFGKDVWGMNAEEFHSRFDPVKTGGQGPLRLRNLYFTYLVELRALAKAAPYLKQELFYTGDIGKDSDTVAAINELLDIISDFPHHFDESKLFQGEAGQLKEEFRLKFLNISRIMDCVSCDKCKLWGKVQVRGMGTALKILFSGNQFAESTISRDSSQTFHLSRVEIASLFNAFGRLSTSIKYIEDFRRLLP